MKLLDRLRSTSARKDSRSKPELPEATTLSSPDTSPADPHDHDTFKVTTPQHSLEEIRSQPVAAATAPAALVATPTRRDGSGSKQQQQQPQHFSWSLRRRRRDSPTDLPAEGQHHSQDQRLAPGSTPQTPQNRDVYIEDESPMRSSRSGSGTASSRRRLATPSSRGTSAALPKEHGTPASGLKAKNLFVSTIDPLIEPPSDRTRSFMARLSPTLGQTQAHASSPSEPPHAQNDEDDPEAAWDYENDIPFYVEEEDHPIIHRILMMQTPQRGRPGSFRHAATTNPEDLEMERSWVTMTVAALDKAGNDLFARGQYEEAYLRYERALLLKRRTLEVEEEAEVGDGTTNGNPATAYAAKDATGKSLPPASAKRSELDSLKLADIHSKTSQEHKATILASVATSINNITYIKQRTGQATTEETMASYLKSLQIKRDILGSDHLSVGKTLNNIGSVFYLKKEYEPALTAYKDAYRIMEAKLGQDHLDVGTVVSNVGDVYFALGDKEQALEHYNRALKIRWTRLKAQDQKVVRLMQQVALLETGVQPNMETIAREGVTDQEEAEVIRDMERHQLSVFIEDIQKLQDEVKDDLRYFDLAERQLEIDMVKDRIRVFREMRELYNASEEFNIEDSLRESMKVIPGLAEQLKRLQNHEYDDVYKEPLNDEVAVEETVANTSETLADKDTGTAETEASLVDTTEQQKERKESLPDEDQFDTALSQSLLENQEPHLSGMKTSAGGKTVTNSPFISQPLRGRVLQDAPDRNAASSLKIAPAGDGDTKIYSPDERKAALDGVRERLERLRRERAQRVRWEDSDETPTNGKEEHQETRRRSYMFPTIASAAKALTPKKLRRVHGGWNRRHTPKKATSMPTMDEEHVFHEV